MVCLHVGILGDNCPKSGEMGEGNGLLLELRPCWKVFVEVVLITGSGGNGAGGVKSIGVPISY